MLSCKAVTIKLTLSGGGDTVYSILGGYGVSKIGCSPSPVQLLVHEKGIGSSTQYRYWCTCIVMLHTSTAVLE